MAEKKTDRQMQSDAEASWPPRLGSLRASHAIGHAEPRPGTQSHGPWRLRGNV